MKFFGYGPSLERGGGMYLSQGVYCGAGLLGDD